MSRVNTKEMARGIMAVQEKNQWSRAQALTHFRISPATFCRWKAGLGGPNVDAYIRVHKKLEEAKLPAQVKAKVAAPVAKKPSDKKKSKPKGK